MGKVILKCDSCGKEKAVKHAKEIAERGEANLKNK